MMYSAVAKEKNTRRIVLLENYQYPTKADFIHDIRANGYTVNVKKVKPSALFDYILRHTNAAPWDWDLKEIPQE